MLFRSPPRVALLGASLLLLGVIPMALALGATRTTKVTIAQVNTGSLVPIVDFGLTAKQTGPNTVQLKWHGTKTSNAHAIYRVFSGPTDGCIVTTDGTPRCYFHMPNMSWTSAVTAESQAPLGRVFYRVALAAGWRFDPNSQGDLLLLSRPVTVTVR